MNRKVLMLLAILALTVAGYATLRWAGGLSGLVAHEQRIRGWIAAHDLLAFAVGLGLYFTISLIPGTSGKAVAAGWLYGFWQAVLLVEFGLTLAATITFLCSRYVLRGLFWTRFGRYLRRLDEIMRRDGGFYLLSLRFAHAPFTLVNYFSGATSISLRTFAWTTAFGLLPGTVVLTFAGSQLPTLHELAGQGVTGLLHPGVVAALLLSAVLPLAVRMLLRTRWPRRRGL